MLCSRHIICHAYLGTYIAVRFAHYLELCSLLLVVWQSYKESQGIARKLATYPSPLCFFLGGGGKEIKKLHQAGKALLSLPSSAFFYISFYQFVALFYLKSAELRASSEFSRLQTFRSSKQRNI